MLRLILIDFAIPCFLIGISAYLLLSGIDGEMKSILLLASGWVFHSSVRTANNNKKGP